MTSSRDKGLNLLFRSITPAQGDPADDLVARLAEIEDARTEVLAEDEYEAWRGTILRQIVEPVRMPWSLRLLLVAMLLGSIALSVYAFLVGRGDFVTGGVVGAAFSGLMSFVLERDYRVKRRLDGPTRLAIIDRLVEMKLLSQTGRRSTVKGDCDVRAFRKHRRCAQMKPRAPALGNRPRQTQSPERALLSFADSHMPQSLANILVHVIFSTQNRQPFITPDILPRLHGQLGAIIRHQEAVPLGIGGVEDHVHILLRLPPKVAFSNHVRDIKALSSKWMHETLGMSGFAWQSGYGAFSVSEMKVQEILHYIANQREHHREVTFQDEFREFLRRHNVAFDERYVWD